MSKGVQERFVHAPLPRSVPEGYVAAPIRASETGSLRVCVLVRSRGVKPGESPLVGLRETLDAKVVLGCVLDAGGRVNDWVELWVQDPSGLGQALAVYREAMSNAVLDARWIARVESLEKLDAAGSGLGTGGLIRTGLEREHPAPMFIDASRGVALDPKDRKSGAAWALCVDEGLLARKGVPGYATTLARNLYQPDLGDDTPFLPTDVADGNAMGLGPEAVGLNPGGGLMMVQRYCPLSFEEFVDAVGGVEGEGGNADALLKSIASAATGEVLRPGAGWLMLAAGESGQSPSARLVEALHLKLMVLAGAVASVRSSVATTQSPMLNLAARSFRVRLGENGNALPHLWTARIGLVMPGESVELPIPGTEAKYYVGGRGGSVSIYAPAGLSQVGSGRGWLRLRNVVAEDAGGLVIEGTLSTQDRVVPGKNDLLWLRYNLGPVRVDQYATLDAKGSMAPGEVRIRSIPQTFAADAAARLKGALGVPIPEVSFEILPLLSSPCDLYALGVLATRTLMTTPGMPLPVALDELFSLAGKVAIEHESGEELWVRLERAYMTEKRWAEALGPQVLAACGLKPDEAFEVIPPRLWMGVVAMIIRCFTGLGPDARCKDYGDAPAGGLHKVFDGVLDDLYALLVACRTLIVSDYRLNAEVRTVVRECMAAAR
ncbi:MAG: hypothetical protein HBSAPP03_26810 [Phycisphaerae bacterium]|nr:MAG: hypothetical protein HBSAPP03_26810 [Phycisphaerae bacterium]